MECDNPIHAILATLVHQWQYDIAVMSQGWMYLPLLIPIMFYLVFFMAKWMFLTAPLWMPILIVAKVIKEMFQKDELQELMDAHCRKEKRRIDDE